jgi:hypothetical protein
VAVEIAAIAETRQLLPRRRPVDAARRYYPDGRRADGESETPKRTEEDDENYDEFDVRSGCTPRGRGRWQRGPWPVFVRVEHWAG